MKVLIVGRARESSAESSIFRALVRAGHRVALVDDVRARQWLGRRAANRSLLARAAAFRPDRLLVGKALDVEPQVLARAARGRPSVMWYQDLRVPPDERIVERARQVDTVFLAAGGMAQDWERRGVQRALFLPLAVDPYLNHPVAPSAEFASEVAFIGSGYDEYRAEFLMRLARRFRVRVWGPGWERWRGELGWTGREARGRDFARACASAAVVLGVNPSFQVEAGVWGYASDRPWKTLACGGFYLGHASPGVRELLADGVHCAWYDDEAHAEAQIERYLSDPAARERIRLDGRDFVLAHHTHDHRARNLMTGEPFANPLRGGHVHAD